MPKIKNWSKAAHKKDWLHDEKSHTVKIRDAGHNSGLYDIKLHIHVTDRENRESHTMRKHIGSASTIEDAEKKAVKWMRNHPHSVKVC